LSDVNGVESAIETNGAIDDFIACSLFIGADYYTVIAELSETPEISLVNPYYLVDNDIDFIVGQTFCCQFYEAISYFTIDSLNSIYNVDIEDADQFVFNNFLLKITDSSPGNVVEIANIYYETGLAVFSEPNLSPEIEWCGLQATDLLISTQSNIKKVIGKWDTATAWDVTTSDSDIIVAVLDDGFAPHIEIPSSRIVAGHDYGDLDSDPSPPLKTAHGMLCGG
jgi:subtilisin family serine protease